MAGDDFHCRIPARTDCKHTARATTTITATTINMEVLVPNVEKRIVLALEAIMKIKYRNLKAASTLFDIPYHTLHRRSKGIGQKTCWAIERAG